VHLNSIEATVNDILREAAIPKERLESARQPGFQLDERKLAMTASAVFGIDSIASNASIMAWVRP
jgi:hypothetical protein